MSSIVLDESAVEKLRDCHQTTVVRDSLGNVIGFFQPPELHVYDKGVIPEFVEQSLKKPLLDGEKLTTDELLKRLRERP